jgi:hypothetical protein
MRSIHTFALVACFAGCLADCSGQGAAPIPADPRRGEYSIHLSPSGGPIRILSVRTLGRRLLDTSGGLVWNGGLVQNTPTIYLVLWGFGRYGDPSDEAPYLERFLKGVGGSAWLNTVTQYYDGAGDVQNYAGELKGVWRDDRRRVPRHPTDAQVQQEVFAAVNKFGYDINASYIVATPYLHDTFNPIDFCASRGSAQSPQGPAAYMDLQYMTDQPRCGENFVNPGKKGLLDGVAILAGWLLADMQTDPNPPTGWTSSNGSGIADLCFDFKNNHFRTGTFPTQALWSNASNSCVQSGP